MNKLSSTQIKEIIDAVITNTPLSSPLNFDEIETRVERWINRIKDETELKKILFNKFKNGGINE